MMIKARSIFEMTPNTWEIEFSSRDEAHKLFDDLIVKYDKDYFGPITVNNDAWYIGTKLPDEKFETSIKKFFNTAGIVEGSYSVTKTKIGKYWMPY